MTLTPEDVVNKRFQPTKFREGYDQDEVDDFLDEVVGELRRLTGENEQLTAQLATCERQGTELRRQVSAAGSAPAGDQGGSAPVTAASSGGSVAASAPVREVPQEKPAAPAPAAPAPAPAASHDAPQPEAATGMLALAQKLHDDFVRAGEEQRDEILGEAKERAGTLVREAEDKRNATLGSLDSERNLLERKIDELRAFERDYRNRMKSYLESQLRDLDSHSASLPGGRPQGPTQTQDAGYGFGSGNS